MSEAGRWLAGFLGRFAPEPGEPGVTSRQEGDEPLWSRSFTPEQLLDLEDAISLLEQAYGSRASRRLERSIAVEKWAQTRTTINSLRQEERAALHTAPTIAAWLWQSLQQPPPDDYSGYGQREACITLADLRLQIDLARLEDGGSVDAALGRMLRFFDEVVEPIMLHILSDMPIDRVHRGAVNYLRRAPLRDRAACVNALEVYIDRPLPDTEDGDYNWGQADGLRLFQELSSSEDAEIEGQDAGVLVRQNVENANPPPGYFAPSLSDEQLIDNLLEVAEDDSRAEDVRAAALHLVSLLERG